MCLQSMDAFYLHRTTLAGKEIAAASGSLQKTSSKICSEQYVLLPLAMGRRLMLNPVIVLLWMIFSACSGACQEG